MKKTGFGHHKVCSILVMDDEQMILIIATQMLQSLGYQVTVCQNGNEAVALYKSALDAGTPFAAVIIDLQIIGGMGGEEAARHILALDPGARLVLSSGNYSEQIRRDYQSYGFCANMPKPYTTSDVSRVLSEILHNRPRSSDSINQEVCSE
jgi:two-component system, cell cycle sensor histidine kinase and response regulator CckA